MTKQEQIILICFCVIGLIILAIVIVREWIKEFRQDDDSITRDREMHKKEIAKELAKLHRKPDLILCECWYLWANIDGKVISEICGVPVLYAGLYGKTHMFVWFDDFDKDANKQCEKMLEEGQK